MSIHAKETGPLIPLARAAKYFSDAIGIVTAGVFIVMLFLMLVQVFTRFVVQVSLPWTQELIIYLFMVVAFLGSVVALRENSHIEIDVLVLVLNKIEDPEKKALVVRMVDTFRYLAICILCLVLSDLCWDFMLKIKKLNYMTSAMGMPKWWIDAVVFFGFAAMAVNAFIKFILSLCGYSTREETTEETGGEE